MCMRLQVVGVNETGGKGVARMFMKGVLEKLCHNVIKVVQRFL